MRILNYFFDIYLSGNGIGTLLSHLVAAVLLCVLYCEENREKRAVIYYAGSVLFNWMVIFFWSSAYYCFFPDSDYGYLITPLLVCVTMGLAYRKNTWLDRLLCACMYISITTLLTAILFPLVIWEQEVFPWDHIKLLRELVTLAIALPIFFSLRKNRLGTLADIPVYFPLLMVAISIIGYAINAVGVLVLTIPFQGSPFTFNFFFSLGLLSTEILTYFMFLYTIRDYERRREQTAEQQRIRGELDLLRSYELSYNQVQIVRHDLQNQYSYVAALLEGKEYDKALAYFKDMKYLVEGLHQRVYCQHKTTNLILNLAAEKASAEQITLEADISLPAVMSIPDVALSSILTNLLDNSIEACRGFPVEKRRIHIVMIMNQNYLLIRVTNPADPAAVRVEQGRLLTTKHNRADHGYGTRIIKKYAEKNEGCAEYRLEGNVFVADVMLRNVPGQEGEQKG